VVHDCGHVLSLCIRSCCTTVLSICYGATIWMKAHLDCRRPHLQRFGVDVLAEQVTAVDRSYLFKHPVQGTLSPSYPSVFSVRINTCGVYDAHWPQVGAKAQHVRIGVNNGRETAALRVSRVHSIAVGLPTFLQALFFVHLSTLFRAVSTARSSKSAAQCRPCGGRPCKGWLSPPPSAASGLDRAWRPAFVCCQ
jgi:hypothetical protein